MRPYGRLARWDRPIGIWLLLFPCWWSSALAAAPNWAQLAGYMALFAVGGQIGWLLGPWLVTPILIWLGGLTL